ncbi:MAG: hypothetical protein IJN54_08420 [Lachnospiraceae bacterium]|nr:hypothetical protein [Lachnospiraceae bacterium]
MRKNLSKKIVMLLSAILMFQTICEPLMTTSLERVYATEIEEVQSTSSESSGVTVSTKEEFMTALSQKQSPITVTGAITIGEQANSTGKMLPVEIPAGIVIQGDDGASISCRCPLQLSGNGVIIKNIELTFESSNALGSVPHREIFLAGYSLTLDNVSTYLAGAGGSLGGFGGTEEELLPTVYAGGFENTTIGTAASLTVKNANSKTMFQGIYMSHGEGNDTKVPYYGNAFLNIGPKSIVRDGIFSEYTEENSRVAIEVTGEGNVNNITFYGNNQTTLTAKQSTLNNITLIGVGTLVLSEKAYVDLAQGELKNVTLQDGACLDLNKMSDVTVTRNFTGGVYNSESQTDTRGILVLNKEGSMTVQGTVSGTTIFQTDNKNFPGEFTDEKQYITAINVESGATGFELPSSKADSYELKYENNGWTIYQLDAGLYYPVVGSIEVISAPTEVDINKIAGNSSIPAKEAPYCEIIWKDEDGNQISSDTVEEMGLYWEDTIIAIKTEYWEDESASEQSDWANVVQLVTVEGEPGRYYFYADKSYYESEPCKVNTGKYTFLLCSEYSEDLKTVADVKAIREKVKTEFCVQFFDSTQMPATVDIGSETVKVQPIDAQPYTGEAIMPVLYITNDNTVLVEGQDYKVTYENNIKVGTNTAKVVVEGIGAYRGTREVMFSIIKSNPTLILTVNEKTDCEAEYEQELSVILQVVPYKSEISEMPSNVELYYEDILLGSAEVGENGYATIRYRTTEQKLPIGKNCIRAEFGGTTELNPGIAQVQVTLKKKMLSAGEVASVQLKDFIGNGSTTTTDIISMTDKNGMTYSVNGTAELPDSKPGTYDKAKIINWSLIGEIGGWYQLPTLTEYIAVSPKVSILEENESETESENETESETESETETETEVESEVETEDETETESETETETETESETEPEEKQGLWIKPIAEQTYTGKAIKPVVEVYEGETLLTKKDYSVTYRKNVNAGTATVTVNGKGNYSGSDTTTFVIQPKNLSEEDITANNVYAFIKKGKVTNPKVTVKFGKKTLAVSTSKKLKDYKFEWPELIKDKDGKVVPQSCKITITGCGNYTGTKTITYDVLAVDEKLMSKVKVTPDIKSVDYFNQKMPGFMLTYGSGKAKETLVLDEDFTITYPDELVIGKNAVTFTAKEGSGFYGTKTFTFTVKGKAISAKSIKIEGVKKSYDFTGSEIKVGMDGLNTLVVRDSARQVNGKNVVLKENVDYTLSYKKNMNAGTATVTINGKGGYTGKKNITFKINKIQLSDKFVVTEDCADYTKNGAKVEVSVNYKGLELVEKKDYTVVYLNNKKIGDNTATVKITGKGNFKGAVKKTYSVAASGKDKITFTVDDTPVPAKLSKLKPKISVIETSTNKKLTVNKDYNKKIEYYIKEDSGKLRTLTEKDLKPDTVVTARLTIKNNSFYDSDHKDDTPITMESTFRLYSAKASSLKVEKIPNQIYTGKEIEPVLVVKDKNGTLLTEYDEETKTGDYIVSYSKNVKVGTAKATVKGVNNTFGGTKTVSFKIVKKKMQFNLVTSLKTLLSK